MARHEKRCRHGNVICRRCTVITDAARRMSDHINARLAFSDPWEIRNCWMAFRLQDGSTDGNLYDSKPDAMRHVSDYKYWAFFCFRNCLNGANPFDCQVFLEYNRHLYTNGGQLPDPDARHPQNSRLITGGPDLIMANDLYDRINNRQRDRKFPLSFPLDGRVMGSG